MPACATDYLIAYRPHGTFDGAAGDNHITKRTSRAGQFPRSLIVLLVEAIACRAVDDNLPFLTHLRLPLKEDGDGSHDSVEVVAFVDSVPKRVLGGIHQIAALVVDVSEIPEILD